MLFRSETRPDAETEFVEIDGGRLGARRVVAERDGLEARSAGVGMSGDEHEVETRPLLLRRRELLCTVAAQELRQVGAVERGLDSRAQFSGSARKTPWTPFVSVAWNAT